jgi:hypothetical protein
VGEMMNLKKNMRAFLITTDGVIAMLVLLIAVMLIGTEWFRPLAPDGLYLKQVSLDVLSILELKGIIDDAIDGDANKIRELFEATPKSMCFQYTIKNVMNGTDVMTILKIDCDTYEKELQTAYNVVIHNGVIYSGKLESWYKKI